MSEKRSLIESLTEQLVEAAHRGRVAQQWRQQEESHEPRRGHGGWHALACCTPTRGQAITMDAGETWERLTHAENVLTHMEPALAALAASIPELGEELGRMVEHMVDLQRIARTDIHALIKEVYGRIADLEERHMLEMRGRYGAVGYPTRQWRAEHHQPYWVNLRLENNEAVPTESVTYATEVSGPYEEEVTVVTKEEAVTYTMEIPQLAEAEA